MRNHDLRTRTSLHQILVYQIAFYLCKCDLQVNWMYQWFSMEHQFYICNHYLISGCWLAYLQKRYSHGQFLGDQRWNHQSQKQFAISCSFCAKFHLRLYQTHQFYLLFVLDADRLLQSQISVYRLFLSKDPIRKNTHGRFSLMSSRLTNLIVFFTKNPTPPALVGLSKCTKS